ncbi:MAG TPA: hypothetical protein VIK30_05800, partial [Polyangia bacterium]
MTALTLPLTLLATVLSPSHPAASPSHAVAAPLQVAQAFRREPNAPPPPPVEERVETRRGHVWVQGK